MTSPETGFDIAELAKQCDVSSRTIRYYGELGLISADSRGPGRRRHYGPDALERLRFITRLKKLGLSLGEIAELNQSFDAGATPGMLEHLEQMLTIRLSEVAERVEELRALEGELGNYLDRIRDKSQRPPREES